MRRFLLIFTFLSVPGWSQSPAHQPAQPPIVVKGEMPPPPPRDFLGYLQALGPLIAASVAVIVGVTQWYLQTKRAKQDLFDKRFHVYEAVVKYLDTLVATQGKVEDHDHGEFRRETDPGEFLFGSDVWQFLVELRKTGVTFESLRREHSDYVAAAMAPDQTTRANLIATYCVEPEDLTHPDEFERQYQNILKQIPILQTQIQEMFVKTCRMSGQSRQVFHPYLQLHYDHNVFARFAASVKRFVDEDVPAKFASKVRD